MLSEYFDYLISLIEGPDQRADNYYELLENLFLEDFWWLILRDKNRAKDGLGLRVDFCNLSGLNVNPGREDRDANDILGHLDGTCSVLEMMIALSRRCDQELMYDFDKGDRTYVWFWETIDNLGLSGMSDGRFDAAKYDKIIDRFLNRTYDFDGQGGLFWIPGVKEDLRNVEIWYQLNWYLSSKITYDFDEFLA